jgi:hypothetical protein
MLLNLLFNSSHNANVIAFKEAPSPTLTPLHANFPLLEAMLQIPFW